MHQATGDISDKWYGQQAVYRLSMGNFVSVGLLACCVGFDYNTGAHTKVSCADVFWPHVSCIDWSEVQE